MSDEADLLARALTGDRGSVREIVDLLTPVIQTRVARTLRRMPGRRAREVHQEVADMTQEVFVALFAERGRILRSWDAERGLSLAGFVGMVAHRQVVSILRSGRRSPWTEDPLEPTELESAQRAGGSGVLQLESREELQLLASHLETSLSTKGYDLFLRLFVANQSPEQIRRETGLSDDAIYAWRSRIRKIARRLAAELGRMPPTMSDSGSPTRIPRQDEAS